MLLTLSFPAWTPDTAHNDHRCRLTRDVLSASSVTPNHHHNNYSYN